MSEYGNLKLKYACMCVSQQLCLVSMFNLFRFSSHSDKNEQNRMHKHLFLRLLLANYLKTGQNRTLLIICNPVITPYEKIPKLLSNTLMQRIKGVRKESFCAFVFFWIRRPKTIKKTVNKIYSFKSYREKYSPNMNFLVD